MFQDQTMQLNDLVHFSSDDDAFEDSAGVPKGMTLDVANRPINWTIGSATFYNVVVHYAFDPRLSSSALSVISNYAVGIARLKHEAKKEEKIKSESKKKTAMKESRTKKQQLAKMGVGCANVKKPREDSTLAQSGASLQQIAMLMGACMNVNVAKTKGSRPIVEEVDDDAPSGNDENVEDVAVPPTIPQQGPCLAICQSNNNVISQAVDVFGEFTMQLNGLTVQQKDFFEKLSVHCKGAKNIREVLQRVAGSPNGEFPDGILQASQSYYHDTIRYRIEGVLETMLATTQLLGETACELLFEGGSITGEQATLWKTRLGSRWKNKDPAVSFEVPEGIVFAEPYFLFHVCGFRYSFKNLPHLWFILVTLFWWQLFFPFDADLSTHE